MKGNVQKMRETLENIDMRIVSMNCIDAVQKQIIDKCRMLIKQALAAPPRNCDVGTAEEQFKRFLAFCHSESRGCEHCPANKTRLRGTSNCDLAWAQMPYEAEEGGSK